ncbi:MAG: DUF86 domain-containing protein [Sandaracinaceae bacterium]|nr:DUF86 domain-containing protein [Sandaracinaceae bacterium]
MSPEQVRAKLAHVADRVAELSQIPSESYESFIADPRNLDAALHRLQTAIQALIDVGSHAVAAAGLRAPSTSHEILELLESAGHLPAGSAARFAPMFGFRNRIVHLYDRVEPRRVYEIVRAETGDLAELARLYAIALARFGAAPR